MRKTIHCGALSFGQQSNDVVPFNTIIKMKMTAAAANKRYIAFIATAERT
jgi:hypothetical protein